MIDEWKKDAKYWDHAWNPMIGCHKVSEGCKNCYAARMAAQYPELQSADGGFEPHPPKHLKRPPSKGVVFVGNMTDIFGEWVDSLSIHEWISALSPSATNLVLTKRAGRLRDFPDNLLGMKHVFYGVTAETQERLNYRVSQLQKTGASKKWISIEPLLSMVRLTPAQLENINWVVVGAESGSIRRRCGLEWVRNVVRQCREVGVPVFVKQLDIDGKLVRNIEKFPEDLQIRQIPW